MNIFVLDLDPALCAQYHCDKHLIKMIVEHCQILGSIAYTARGITRKKDITPEFILKHFQGFPRSRDGQPHPYGIGFKNHPCTQWAGHSFDNYVWLCKLTLEMCKEYTRRYKKKHVGEAIANWYYANPPELPLKGMTPFAQAMPDVCKNPNPVTAYRDYYKQYKARFAKWAHSPTPKWYVED
jgi:hypothetical protein